MKVPKKKKQKQVGNTHIHLLLSVLFIVILINLH